MPTIPLTNEVADIFSLGFGKNLLRSNIKRLTDAEGFVQGGLGEVDPVTMQSGRTIAGWVIGEDKLYNKNITIDAKIGRITVGGASGIIIDDSTKKITIGGSTGIDIDAATKKITVGASNIVIDAANKYILINDGTNDRVLLGYDAGGF